MVPFAGYSLPVQFKEGVLNSHLHTRADNSASVFDVGHMGQIRWHGKDATKFLETLVVGDIEGLKPVRPLFCVDNHVVYALLWMLLCRAKHVCRWSPTNVAASLTTPSSQNTISTCA
jgi:hypothetical protein